MEKEEIQRLIATALGEVPPEVLIRGGTLLNVLTEEVIPGVDVAISGGRIAYIGHRFEGEVSKDTLVIDAGGLFMAPGFIDPHCHLDFVFQVREYSRFALPRGTTTVVTEAAMVANAAGPQAVGWFLREAMGAPLRVFLLCPSVIPPFPQFEQSAGFPRKAFEELIAEDFCLGLGETYWPRVVMDRDGDILGRFAEVLKRGKRLEGHTAGAKGRKLQAYISSGIGSCHEATSQQEALELLRLGSAVMIRQGYIRQELPAVAPLRGRIRDLRNLMLCTDLLDPETLMERGALDWAVREAVAQGFSPMEAIKMATLNPATYFGLKDLGLLAPGKRADILLLEGLGELRMKMVFLDGQLVAEDGRLLLDPPSFSYPPEAMDSFRLRPLSPHHFRVPYQGKRVRVRALEVKNDTITAESWVELPVRSGNVCADPERDILKVAQILRHSSDPVLSVGFVKGLGLKEGALATSLTWDTNNIFVVGATEEDMAQAVNALLRGRGGFFAVKGREVLGVIHLPIYGIISPKPMEEIRREIREFEEVARRLGMRRRAFVVLQTLPFSGLPHLRLTEKGLLDVKKRSFVPLLGDAQGIGDHTHL